MAQKKESPVDAGSIMYQNLRKLITIIVSPLTSNLKYSNLIG